MNQPPLNPDALVAAYAVYAEMTAEQWRTRPPSGWREGIMEDVNLAVSAYLAAALPEVTEREQLTALADKIVLEDRRGTIWQKINGTWYTPGSKHDYSDQSVMLPARVLYRPSEKS